MGSLKPKVKEIMMKIVENGNERCQQCPFNIVPAFRVV